MSTHCTYVIFGATGNLSRIKLMPALYHLECAKKLSSNSRILLLGRRPWRREQTLDEVRRWVSEKARGALDEAAFDRFIQRIDYFRGDLTDPEMYSGLSNYLSQMETPSENIAYYMAISPAEFGNAVERLHEANLLDESLGWKRVVIEKPFGYDLESAQALQRRLGRCLREEQIFRIDHYLGKSTVQNVLVFRFANTMMEPLWNRNYIDHIQITHSETLGVGSRGGFYDSAGAMRDMIQSHLLQLLTLVTMEPPVSMEAESLRDEKVKVLKSVRPIPPRQCMPTPSAPSTPKGAATARRLQATCRRRTYPKRASPRPTLRSSSISTTGAGVMFPSTCAPASAWRRGSR